MVAVTEALIYTRVSSDEQAREGLSLDAQVAECRRYSVLHDWALGPEYQDVMTGRRDDRPQYQMLLSDVRRLRSSGRHVVVVVAALDRLGRRLQEQVRCREELSALGVSVHSVRDGGEVNDFVANILASVAQEEIRRLSERVSASHRHTAASGWQKVGWVAWGYLWRNATPEERRTGAPAKVLAVNELEAPYVREAFRRVANGETVRGITIWVAGLPDDVRGGRNLSYPAVRRMLSAPVYISRPPGATTDDPIGKWPPLVDDGTWQQVQEYIESHSRRPRQASGRYLLTGFVRCQRCGSRMSGGAEKRIPARYRCRATDQGAAASNPRCSEGITAPKLDAAVLSQVERLVEAVASDDVAHQAKLRNAWRMLHLPQVTDETNSARAILGLESAARKARDRLKRAALYFVDGELTKSDYEQVRAQAQADLESAEAEIERLRSSSKAFELPLLSLDEVLRRAGDWGALLHGADISVQRDLLALLIEQIEPVRVSHGKFDAVIRWTPLGDALQKAVTLADHAA